MAGASTWARSLRGMIAALLLAVLTLGPSVDALICGDEAGAAAAAAEVQTVIVQATPDTPDDHGSGMSDVCIHGHCHHYAPFVPILGAGEQATIEPSAQHDWWQTTIRKSDPHFGLKRPPRA